MYIASRTKLPMTITTFQSTIYDLNTIEMAVNHQIIIVGSGHTRLNIYFIVVLYDFFFFFSFLMPPFSKKLGEHIALVLSVHPSVRPSCFGDLISLEPCMLGF